MSDGKFRFRTVPLISAIMLMMLASAVPSALAYSPTWDGMTPLIEDKSQAVVIADNANDTTYIIGGGLGIAGSQFSSASDSVIAYNVNTGASTRVASMPQGVRGACGGLGEDGKIYIFSGFNGSNIDTTQIYDIATDSWSTGTSIPSMVFKGDCVVAWPEFYVFGWTGPDAQVQVFSTVNGTWYIGAPLPQPRQSGAAVYSEMENAIYYMGGKNAGDVPQSTVYRFAIESGAWTTVQSLPNQLMAFDAAVGPDGLIYAVGGTDNDYPFTQLVYSAGYYYCPNNDTWYSLPAMDFARKYLGVVSIPDGRILAIGGNNDTAILGYVESLSLVDASSSLSSSSVGQGGSAMLTLTFDSYASQTGADLKYFLKSDAGTVYPVQSCQFAFPGNPSTAIEISQLMPAGQYELHATWKLNFQTGAISLPEETIHFGVFATIPLTDQVADLQNKVDQLLYDMNQTNSTLTSQLNSALNQLTALKNQNNNLQDDIDDLMLKLNETEDDLLDAIGDTGGRADDAMEAASSAGTYAMIGTILIVVLIVIMVINIMMGRKK